MVTKLKVKENYKDKCNQNIFTQTFSYKLLDILPFFSFHHKWNGAAWQYY